MDILVSSNLERLLYFISGKNNEVVKGLMDDLNTKGMYEVDESMKAQIQADFYAETVLKEDTYKTIKNTFENFGYLLDTHTAVAYKTLEEYKKETSDDTVSVVMSTASPFKFSKSVYEALYGTVEEDEFKTMFELSKRTGVQIPENLKGLENRDILHKTVCEVDEMKKFVLEQLGL
jgi:threonine synthase